MPLAAWAGLASPALENLEMLGLEAQSADLTKSARSQDKMVMTVRTALAVSKFLRKRFAMVRKKG